MKQRRLTIGPGAASLVLMLVVVSMCVLGMLMLITAKNDAGLSDRAAQVAAEIAALDARAERTLAGLDALLAQCAQTAGNEEDYIAQIRDALPGGMTLEDGRVCWREEENGRSLECAVEIAPMGNVPRAQWSAHRLTAGSEDEWN